MKYVLVDIVIAHYFARLLVFFISWADVGIVGVEETPSAESYGYPTYDSITVCYTLLVVLVWSLTIEDGVTTTFCIFHPHIPPYVLGQG
jgi:hypothetical protein